MSTYLLLFFGLLEKVAVIVVVAFVLATARPFQSLVLRQATWLRQVAVVVIFALVSVWGSHLGFEVLGVPVNNRAVGILVAGLLGGPAVGLAVGLVGGAYFAFLIAPDSSLAPYLLLASALDGLLSGLLGRRLRASRMRVRQALGAALAVQLAHLAVVGLLLLPRDSAALLVPQRTHLALLAELLQNALGVALFVGIVRTSLQLRETEVALSRQAAATTRARLQALQAQIRPHFLFNTLNTIAALIRSDPKRARSLVSKLANLYRQLLRPIERPVPLGDELAQVQAYLEIEHARFGERLRVAVDVPTELRSCRVPPLVLQPLVENAIKHGLASLPEGGTVLVEARQQGPELLLRVSDDGVGYDDQPFGTGLSNVAERLALLPGERRATLTLGAREQGRGTSAEIRLPSQSQQAEAEADDPAAGPPDG